MIQYSQMIQTPKKEAILYKAIFKNLSCHIKLNDINKFAVIVRIGKQQSKYTQKKQIDSFNIKFQNVLQVQIEQKDLNKTHRSQKVKKLQQQCQCMLYKFKEYQGKQNRELIGMASINLNTIRSQQATKRFRLTNSLDRQAYIEICYYAKKIQSIPIQQIAQSRVSQADHQFDVKSIKSLQIIIPEDKQPISNFTYGIQNSTSNRDSQNKETIQGQVYNSRYSENKNHQFYNNDFPNSPVNQFPFKQQRSVDLISSLQDQIDILNNKLQNSQKQLVEMKRSKVEINNESRINRETNKITQEIQRQNNILRQRVQQLQKNLKSKNKINHLDSKYINQNNPNDVKNYFSQGSKRQSDQVNQKISKNNKLFQKYTFDTETTDQNLKKKDENNNKSLGFTFQSNCESGKNFMEASSPYFKNYQKSISFNNQIQSVLQFYYEPIATKQSRINESFSQIQRVNNNKYHKFQGKGKNMSKHKIIGYIKNESNNSFLYGSQHQSVVSQANTNPKYKTINVQSLNSDEQYNESLINIIRPVQEDQIRCSIDPRNNQGKITLQQYNKQTQQFRKREKALRRANQKFLIQNRKLKKQRQQLIQSNKLSLNLTQTAQNQQLKCLKIQNRKLEQQIQMNQEKANILTKKYQLYLNENNKLKNDMKSHLKTIKQYRLALYSKDEQNKEEQQLRGVKHIQSNSTSSKYSAPKDYKKIPCKPYDQFDTQSAASQHISKNCDTGRIQTEGMYSSHVVLNKIPLKNYQIADNTRQLVKSNSSKGIAQMKTRGPLTPNIPKPVTFNNSKNGFDSFAKEGDYVKIRKNTSPLIQNRGTIFRGANRNSGK